MLKGEPKTEQGSFKGTIRQKSTLRAYLQPTVVYGQPCRLTELCRQQHWSRYVGNSKFQTHLVEPGFIKAERGVILLRRHSKFIRVFHNINALMHVVIRSGVVTI